VPHSLDEAEDDLPRFDEGPAFAEPVRTRGGRSSREPAFSPHGTPRDLAESRRSSAPANGAARPGGELEIAPSPPAPERWDSGWRLEDPPPSASGEVSTATADLGARFLPRAIAFGVDLFILGLLDGVLFIATVAAVGLAAFLRSGSIPDSGDLVEGIFTAGQIGLFLGYFGLLHAGPGQTLGKALVGLRVIGSDGRDLGVRESLLRAGAYVFSALPLGIGFLMAAVPPRRALHDYLIGSRVVPIGRS
jgi:uncharacterized RDD family membrane protein YckC